MDKKLEHAKVLATSYLKVIGADTSYLPSFEEEIREGFFIEYDDYNNTFYYGNRERNIVERAVCLDLDDLLYKIFVDITLAISIEFELRNRIEGEDFRRIVFSKQEELMSRLNKQWLKRLCSEHSNTLRHFPFREKP